MSKRSGIFGWAAVVPAIMVVILAAEARSAAIGISTFEELCRIGADAGYPLGGDYELTANIDASASRELGYEPIGRVRYLYGDVLDTTKAFTGRFDGKGFKVSGLYINRVSTAGGEGTGVGLFGYARGAEIKNLYVAADSVIGYSDVGAVVGRAFASAIEGCRSSGAVVGETRAGGLAGAVEGLSARPGTVASSYSSASVSGKSFLGGLIGSSNGRVAGCYSLGPVAVADASGQIAGGLVGYNDGGVVSRCYAMSAVSGAGASSVGGLVGANANGGEITTSYSAGPVSGAGAGGFAGDNGGGQILYSYLDTERSGQPAAITGVTGMASAGMKRAASFSQWNFNTDTLWAISNNYPYLKKLPFYTITFTASPGGTVGGGPVHVQRANYGIDGAAAAAEASADSGGESFSGWYLPGEGEKLTGGDCGGFTAALSESGDTIALSGLSGDVAVEARFTLKKYTLTYVARANGKILTEGGDPSAAKDTVVHVVGHGQLGPRVRAVPDVSYRFVQWSWRDTSAARADTAWSDTTFTAAFVSDTLTVNYSISAEDFSNNIGRLNINERVNLGATPLALQRVAYGEPGPVVQAVSAPRYRFVMWSDSATSNPRVDTVKNNINVTAVFAIKTFTLAYTAGPGGKIAVAGAAAGVFIDTVEYGGSGPRVTAVPDSGYAFVRWDDVNTKDPSRTDSLVQADVNAVAVFENISDAVKSSDRVIPGNTPNDELAIVRPLTITAGEFTAGPNPVLRRVGMVSFFWDGRWIDNGTLFIHDVTGNVVGKIAVSDDNILSNAGKRKVASWDLTDGNGRAVSGGTYLVRGTLFRKDGKSEKVSIVLGVR